MFCILNSMSLFSLWCSFSLLTAKKTSSRLLSPNPYVAILNSDLTDSIYSNIKEYCVLPSLEHLKSILISDFSTNL